MKQKSKTLFPNKMQDNTWEVTCFRHLLYFTAIVFLSACKLNTKANTEAVDTTRVPRIVEMETKDPVPASIEYTYHLKGSINNKYGIIVQLVSCNGRLSGYYKYTKQDNKISLEGTLIGDKLHLEHRVHTEDTALLIESFDGRLSETAITGSWKLVNRDQSFPFVMTPYHGTKLTDDQIFITNSEYQAQDSCWHLSEVKVYDNKGNLTQSIGNFEAKMKHNILQLEDFNYDGYWDLSICDTIKSNVAPLALHWIFHPTTRLFERDTTESIQSRGAFDFTVPDPKRKKAP